MVGVSALAPSSSSSRAVLPELDLLCETDLVVLGEERILADVGEIQANEIFFVALDTLLRHAGVLLLTSGAFARLVV